MCFCESYNERIIKKGLENVSVSFCKTCAESRRKYNGVSILSKENNLDLFAKGYPHHLPS